MAIDRKNGYEVPALLSIQAADLKDYSTTSRHFRTNVYDTKTWSFELQVQNVVNRIILLEGEKKGYISEGRWLQVNGAARVMAERPHLAPIIAAGFAATVEK